MPLSPFLDPLDYNDPSPKAGSGLDPFPGQQFPGRVSVGQVFVGDRVGDGHGRVILVQARAPAGDRGDGCLGQFCERVTDGGDWRGDVPFALSSELKHHILERCSKALAADTLKKLAASVPSFRSSESRRLFQKQLLRALSALQA